MPGLRQEIGFLHIYAYVTCSRIVCFGYNYLYLLGQAKAYRIPNPYLFGHAKAYIIFLSQVRIQLSFSMTDRIINLLSYLKYFPNLTQARTLTIISDRTWKSFPREPGTCVGHLASVRVVCPACHVYGVRIMHPRTSAELETEAKSEVHAK
jgi:hypothetical protein